MGEFSQQCLHTVFQCRGRDSELEHVQDQDLPGFYLLFRHFSMAGCLVHQFQGQGVLFDEFGGDEGACDPDFMEIDQDEELGGFIQISVQEAD